MNNTLTSPFYASRIGDGYDPMSPARRRPIPAPPAPQKRSAILTAASVAFRAGHGVSICSISRRPRYSEYAGGMAWRASVTVIHPQSIASRNAEMLLPVVKPT